MKINFHSNLFQFLFYACWALIIFVTITYLLASSSPWAYRAFNLFEMPKIDPLVQIDNRTAIPAHPRYFTEEQQKSDTRVYSIVTNQSYSEVFYRPDFKQDPIETLLILVCRLLTFIGIVLFLYLLANVLRSIVHDDPITMENYKRVYWMGIFMVLLPLVRIVHSSVLVSILEESPRMTGWELSTSYLSIWTIPLGLVLLVISYVFKELIRIYEEQKLTI